MSRLQRNVSTVDVLRTIIDQAKSGPNLPAVADLDRSLTYDELVHDVARVAAGLSDAGVVEGDRVALLLPNSVNFVVAALASMWLGAAFVPFAVSDPDTRLIAIATDCAPTLIVTTRESDDTLAHTPLLELFVHRTFDELRGSREAVVTSEDPSRIAYAIYTSGTTGTPKGVLIHRAAFGAAVQAASTALGLSRTTRALCVSPFHFDGSYGTLFPTLFAGGAIVIRPRDALLFPRTFFKAIKEERITYTGFSPSYLRLLLASPQIQQLAESNIDVIALGGEASSVADVRALQAFAPAIRVFNRYGPTESTIAVTHVHLTPELVSAGVVPIGIPHPEVFFFLLGEQGQLIEGPDETGELYIGGSQLMTGYWGAPELTRAVLRTDVVPGMTLYRTGDLMARNRDGIYCYVGRIDDVIKRSGVRISLLEMSEAVRAIAQVTAAACLTFDNEGTLGIAAFVVTDEPLTAFELQLAIRERLPDSMLPDRFVVVGGLPLTKSGKLDERTLLSEAGLDTLRPTT
jgi:amino acid adenylation domain-containing protein